MTRYLTFILLLTIVGLVACSGGNPSTPEFTGLPSAQSEVSGPTADFGADADVGMESSGNSFRPDQEPQGKQTYRNGYTVEQAVWQFAQENNGDVPRFVGDTNLAGKTLYDYLPGGERLVNAFTRYRTEPRDGAAGTSGEVGYMTIMDQGYVVGFTITAQGTYYPYQLLRLDRYLADH